MSISQSRARVSEPSEPARGQNGGQPSGAEPRGYLFLPQSMKRGRFLVWLRRTHAWIGLWGAALGLLFGTSGILLNHRNEMKIPLASQHETRQTLVPPMESLQSAEAFEAWLRVKFKLRMPSRVSRRSRAGPCPGVGVK